MHSPARQLHLSLIPIALLLAAAPAQAQTALDRGEILVSERKLKKYEVPEVVVKAVIKAPPDKVWDVVSHCGRYYRTMPRIKRSEEVYRQGNIVKCKVTVDVPFPYSDTTALTRCVHKIDKEKGSYLRTWSLIKGDYKLNQGSWKLTRYKGKPDQTYAVYRAIAQPNAYVPGWIKSMAQKSSLPKMVERIRSLTEKKGNK